MANVGRGLATNPVLWGIGAGLGANLLGLELPAVVDQLAGTLGAAALPAALFALGANLSRFRIVRACARPFSCPASRSWSSRLSSTCWRPGLRLAPVSLAVAVTIAALPTGINAYLFAARYEAAVPAATGTILVSTLLSAASLGLLLATLRS